MSILKSGLYFADCLVLLERIPDRSIDLVYVDPPWNMPSELNENTDQDYIQFMRRVIRQFWRVLSPTGNLLIHIVPETGEYIRPLLQEVFNPIQYRPEIPIPLNRVYLHAADKSRAGHEIVLHYAMSTTSTYNRIIQKLTDSDAEYDRFSQKDENGRRFELRDLLAPFSRQQRPTLWFEFKGHLPPESRTWRNTAARLAELDKDGRIYQRSPEQRPRLKFYLDEHPGIDVTNNWQDVPLYERPQKHKSLAAQRSLELMDKLIRMTSNPGDVVLDVFCGTGTTLVSAQNNGRRWIGCDNFDEAFETAKSRLENEAQIEFGTGYVSGNESYLVSEFSVVRSSAFPRFFVSYKREDLSEFVLPLCAKLERSLIDVWIDQRDIEVGDPWEERIQDGLAKCAGLILFMTPSALKSTWVEKEWRAFRKAKKPIFPVLCRDTLIPSELKKIQHVAYSDHEKLIEKLLKFKVNT